MADNSGAVPISALIACAQGNDAGAQYDLALAYTNGEGMSVNRSEAYFWLSVCIHVTGHFWSPNPDEFREKLASRMTGLDVFLAERRAEEWIDRHGALIVRDDP